MVEQTGMADRGRMECPGTRNLSGVGRVTGRMLAGPANVKTRRHPGAGRAFQRLPRATHCATTSFATRSSD
jgi:hypothetical protein